MKETVKMADVSSACEVSPNLRKGDPYLRDTNDLGLPRLLKTLVTPGRYAGAVTTEQDDVITIPAGSVFLVPLEDEGLVRVEFVENVTITTDAVNDTVVLFAEYNTSGGFDVIIEAMPSDPGNALVLGVNTGGTWTEDVNLDSVGPRKLYLKAELERSFEADAALFFIPVKGHATRMWSVIDGAIASNTVLTASVVGGSNMASTITITAASSALGDVDTAALTTNNAVNRGDVVKVVSDGAGSAGAKVVVMLEITVAE
jgi:hypothetical protein